jgi:hypothetical protein
VTEFLGVTLVVAAPGMERGAAPWGILLQEARVRGERARTTDGSDPRRPCRETRGEHPAVQGGSHEEKQSGGAVRALAASAVRRSAIDGTEGTGPIRFAEQ